jgi:hypothetical protein
MICVLFAVPDDDMDSCTCSFTNNNWWQCLFSPTLTLMLVGCDDHVHSRLEGPTKVDEKPPPPATTPPKTSTLTLAVLIAAAVCLTFHLLHSILTLSLNSSLKKHSSPFFFFFLLFHTLYPPHTPAIMSVSTVETKPFQDQKPGT